MISNYCTRSFASDSENFTLHLSEESYVLHEDTQEEQHVPTDKMENENDVIVISDSTSNSSFKSSNVPDSREYARNKTKTMHSRPYAAASSSEDEQEMISRPWRMPGNEFSLNKRRDKTATYIDETIDISDDNIVNNSDTSCNMTNQTKKCDTEKSSKTPTSRFPLEKTVRRYSVKQTDKMITPNVNSLLDQLHTPKQSNTEKMKLTKKDTLRIVRNIRQMAMVMGNNDSPRERKQAHVIDESTDLDDDAIHPAVSPKSIKKLINCNDTSLNKDNVISDSQQDSPKSHEEKPLHRPLSERKKKQITEWLMTNSPDCGNDSTSSVVPPSTRNSDTSGNSSLERLERYYETPNNRGRRNIVQTAQRDEEQSPIADTPVEVNQPTSTYQTVLDRFVEKSTNNNCEFKTPDRTVLPQQANKEISTEIKTTETNITDYADILDKFYGKSWRNKADMLFTPVTEPRKKSIQTMNRAVQTERKPSRKQYHMTYSDSEESDFSKDKIKVIKKKRNWQKQRDSFINDESLSSNDSNSIYHTAITNPISTISRPTPISASIKRLQTICDSDSDDESNNFSSNRSFNRNLNRRNLNRKQLSFDDDESSDRRSSITSEFDPEDHVPPKNISRKKTAKTPQSTETLGIQTKQSKITSKFISTNNSTVHKSFLESLSSTVPMNSVHPDAKIYRLDFKGNKEALCKKLYKLYNSKVFDDKLPQNMTIEWNVRMRGTAGFCYNNKSVQSLSGVVRSSRIVLATKILDTPDRLRDTLIHELCHAAAWLINDVSDGHGPFWMGWANKAMRTFPELPQIRRCHDYEIKTKFTYRCTGCGYSIGRHSKSLDVEKKRCGYCFGKFEVLINKTTKSGTVQIQTPKKQPSGFALYVKENYNLVKKDKSNMRHGEVMKILGQQFSAIKIVKKNDSDMPS